MRSFGIIKALICISAICIVIFSCKKNDFTPISSIHIYSISPITGKYGINDTIHGQGFGDAIGDLKFYFNGSPAGIINLNDTVIIVKVPKEAGTGYVSIEKGSEKINGPLFNYIYTVTVSTLAGKGYEGYLDGGTSDALFSFPRGLCMDANGNIYVADNGNNRIRKISPDNKVSTIAGNGIKSYRDGPASDAEFDKVNGLVFDHQDNLYITDGTRIRKLSLANNIVSTVAGDGNNGSVDGSGVNAEFSLPYGIIADKQGNFFISDAGNNNIRRLTVLGDVTTIAGNISGGYADGNGINALFNLPGGITIDEHNNMYVADAANFRIRIMNPSGEVNTFAGNGNFGYLDGRFFNAEFKFPTGITVDKKNNVYVCGEENVIRKINTLGDVSTIAGSGIHGYADGTGEEARFNQPIYMFMDANGILYVSDQSNHCIRKIVIE